MKNNFNNYCTRIEIKYKELGHQDCWSFLGTSENTLYKNSSIALITANPGGSWEGECKPVMSYENSNIY